MDPMAPLQFDTGKYIMHMNWLAIGCSVMHHALANILITIVMTKMIMFLLWC